MSIKKTRVYKLFAAFTKDDRKEFLRYLRRYSKPKRQRLKAGYRFLVHNQDAIEESRATLETWWETVFTGLPYDVKQLRKHQNKLTSAMSDCLVEQRWQKEKDPYRSKVRALEQQLLLMASVWDHGLDPLFASLSQKATEMVAALPEDHDRYALQYQLELLKIGHRQKVSPLTPIANFAQAQEALDHYYVINALKLELANKGHARFHSIQQPQLNHLDAIQAVMQYLPAANLLVQLYLRVSQLSATTTVAQTETLLAELFAAEKSIAPEAWRDLLYLCLNFAITHVNNGAAIFKVIVLQIYLKLLQSGVLQRDMVTFKHNFLNIVKLSFFWDPPEEFARYAVTQKALIANDEEYKNAAQFYECQRQFSDGNFKNACPCFLMVWLLEGGRNVRYAAGIFLIQSQYELGEYDALIQFSNDLKRIISHDKGIAPVKKEAYRQFLKGMHILCNIQFHGMTPAMQGKLRAMETLIQEDYVMVSKDWFQTQIDRLWKTKK